MENITKEFCKKNILIFYPDSEPESAFIQERLFDMGCYWDEGKGVRYLKNTVKDAMVIRGGQMLYGVPTSKDLSTGIVCTSDQFDVIFDKSSPQNLSDRELLMALFNKVSDLAEEVTAIKAEILPKHLQKDIFKPK